MENSIDLSGVKMPRLIYGTAWKKDRTADLVTRAVNCGFRGIDTACQPKHYNEAGVGVAIQRLLKEGMPRKELYIQTKFTPIDGQDPFNIPYNASAPLCNQVEESFENSKKNLGISYVNGLILHSPLENHDRTMIAWQAMESVHKQGGALLLGISNCYDLETLKQLYEASSVKPSILQNRFYHATDYDREIRQWCEAHQVAYQSFWTLTANPQILSNEIVQKTAEMHQKTAAQILFYVLAEMRIVPLIGTCSDQHMLQDLEVFNFKLPKKLTEEIATLFC